MPYTRTMDLDARSHPTVFFAYHSHVVWDHIRRKRLGGDIETRLKERLAQRCQEHQVEREELEALADHVHLLVNVDPIQSSSAGETAQRPFFTPASPAIS